MFWKKTHSEAYKKILHQKENSMKKVIFSQSALLFSMAIVLSGCSAIEGIFNAGMAWAFFLVAVVVIALFLLLRKKK